MPKRTRQGEDRNDALLAAVAPERSPPLSVPSEALEAMREKRDLTRKQRLIAERNYRLVTFIVFSLIVAGGMWSTFDYMNAKPYYLGPFVIFVSLSLVMACTLPVLSSRMNRLEEDEQILEFEIDLERFKVSDQELRAEKILWLHQAQLRRYYELNLRQNAWVLAFGVACVCLGGLLVGGTLFLVLKQARAIDEQIVVGVLGSVGAFLANYVATMYLKMHSAVANDLGTFHGRLVGTHQILLGSLLASRISDDQKRQETLSQLALKITDAHEFTRSA